MLYYITYIESRAFANSDNNFSCMLLFTLYFREWTLIGCYATSLREWMLIGCYATSIREWTLIGIVGVVAFNPQAPKIHCAFSRSRRHKIWNWCCYSTKYMTHFQYRFMSPLVKFSFEILHCVCISCSSKPLLPQIRLPEVQPVWYLASEYWQESKICIWTFGALSSSMSLYYNSVPGRRVHPQGSMDSGKSVDHV